MRKILIVINSLSIGGAERLVVDQANSLVKNGLEVDVLTLSPQHEAGFYGDLNLSNGQLLNIEARNFSIRSVLRVNKVIRQGNYDAVISHLFLANTLTRMAKAISLSKWRTIAYEHNIYESEKRFKHLLIDFLLSLITYKIIAVSSTVRDYLVRNMIPQSKIVVIPNGISTAFLNNLTPRGELRKGLGLEAGDLLIASVGNVNPQKGYETLIESAEIVVKNNPKVFFVICGSDTNSYALSLKKLVSDKNLGKNFRFLGPRLDATSVANAADVFAMTSLWEGLSISLLEALLLGKVIVVSRIPSFLALITEGYNGVTFEVGDSHQLAGIIGKITKNISEYQMYGENAKIVGSRYSIGSNVGQILDLLK